MPIKVIVRPAGAHTHKYKFSGHRSINFIKPGPPASQKPIRVSIHSIPIGQVSTSEAAFFSLSEGPRGLGLQVSGPLRIQAFDI